MNLLIGANISWRLVKKLDAFFNTCQHVNFIGLKNPVTDILIWKYAMDSNFTILTQDDDFEKILEINGFPPKLIVIKTPNIKTADIELLIKNKLEQILEFQTNTNLGILEIY
jgi:predicted nuclease of predicted toxin-antitoxin system